MRGKDFTLRLREAMDRGEGVDKDRAAELRRAIARASEVVDVAWTLYTRGVAGTPAAAVKLAEAYVDDPAVQAAEVALRELHELRRASWAAEEVRRAATPGEAPVEEGPVGEPEEVSRSEPEAPPSGSHPEAPPAD